LENLSEGLMSHLSKASTQDIGDREL
jgi:hypothetical protein